jgi:hypothetical protein
LNKKSKNSVWIKSHVNLLNSNLLYPDAQKLTNEIIKLIEEDSLFCPYHPGTYFYPLLIHQNSKTSNIFNRHFSKYKGNILFQSYKESIDNNRERFDVGDDNFIAENLKSLIKGLGEDKVNACQLAAALLFPFNDLTNDKKTKPIDLTTYDFKNFVESEIEGGCYSWMDIDESSLTSLAHDLITSNENDSIQKDNILQNFNLILKVEGKSIKVVPVEAWGDHNLTAKGYASTSNGLLLPNQTIFIQDELNHFESLLNSQSSYLEQMWQEFFQENPHWFYLIGDYENMQSQLSMKLDVFLTTNQNKSLIPDFFLKRSGLELWDVLEIKPPTKRVVVGKESRRRWSAQVEEAVAQVKIYSNWFNDKSNINWFKNKHGLQIEEPNPVVLIGRDHDFKSDIEKQRLQRDRNVKLFTYDDLHRIAKHRSFLIE